MGLKVGDTWDANLASLPLQPGQCRGVDDSGIHVGRNPMRVHSTAFQCLQLANSHQFALMQFLSESEYRESASEGVEWVAVKNLIPAQSSQ